MRSIRARVTVLYALSATLTLAVLFVLGYVLLRANMIAGLDYLNAEEFEQIKASLGSQYLNTLDPIIIDERIRETTERASVRFYISAHSHELGVLFKSSNLLDQEIPDIPGQKAYDAHVEGVGDLRVSEFVLSPLEIIIATPLDQVAKLMEGYVEVSSGLLGLMALISIAVGVRLAQVIILPFRLIGETAMRIGSDNLSERIPVPGVRDEISDLAHLLNLMFDRIEAAFDQIRHFASDASHELKTPLSLIRLHAERLLVKGDLSAEHQEAVLIQLDELARLNRIVEELLFLSRAEAKIVPMEIRRRDPALFLDSFRQDAQVLVEHHGMRLDLRHDGRGEAAFDDKWIRQVLLNLITNALKVSKVGNVIRLRSEMFGQLWRFGVTDEGPGLNEEERNRMFDRFARFGTMDRNDQGSGLGLAICRSIVELHRGRIFAEPAPGGRGLCVTVEIPLFA